MGGHRAGARGGGGGEGGRVGRRGEAPEALNPKQRGDVWYDGGRPRVKPAGREGEREGKRWGDLSIYREIRWRCWIWRWSSA